MGLYLGSPKAIEIDRVVLNPDKINIKHQLIWHHIFYSAQNQYLLRK